MVAVAVVLGLLTTLVTAWGAVLFHGRIDRQRRNISVIPRDYLARKKA